MLRSKHEIILGRPLSEVLFQEGYRFDFFQAVRLLQRMACEESAAERRWPQYPVGLDHSPRQEVVRFRALPAHSFPPGSIRMIGRPDDRGRDETRTAPAEMITSFLGLTGPNGALPQHYTTLLIERVRAKDFALRDFLDLFNHRLISLFYRAWEKYRFAIAYERHELEGAEGRDDLFTACLYCLVGLGTAGLRGRLQFDDEAFLFYAGYFAHFPRSALALEIMLGDYFELPVRLEQFQGQWLYLSRDDRSCLPSSQWPQGRHNQVGASVVLGERVWDVESKFRVRLGPLGYRAFCRFLPFGDALRPLGQMVRSYVGPQFDFDVQPVLKAAEVPWCRLGGDGADPSRLGWNTWLRSRPFERNVDDAVFSPEG
jgi:type VI secretion system protein ImpH